MSRFEEDVSVGQALRQVKGFNIYHPNYLEADRAINEKVTRLAAVRGEAIATTRPFFTTLALTVDEKNMVSREYPELNLCITGAFRAPNLLYVQLRRCAMQWCVMQAEAYGKTVVCYGALASPLLQSKFDDAMVYVDSTDPVAVHERYAVVADSVRLYEDYIAMTKAFSVRVRRDKYIDFVRGDKFRMVTDSAIRFEASVMCVDGSLTSYSPLQVASLMLKAKSELVFGFIPYHPNMLLNLDGELAPLKVGYTIDSERVSFKFAETLAGVSVYDRKAYMAWLTGHTFCVGEGEKSVWFQLELLKVRTGFMFYRMVKLAVKPVKEQVQHALHLPISEPTYIVSSWRLKSLALNSGRNESWERKTYYVNKRLFDRLYTHLMNLPQDGFTRYAVRKQIEVVNGRIVVEGSSVKINQPLKQDVVDALTVDMFIRVYIDRYLAGTLTSQAKAYVDGIEQFSKLSMRDKACYLTLLYFKCKVNQFWKPVDDTIRNVVDYVRDVFKPKALKISLPDMQLAPEYVLVSGEESVSMDLERISCAKELSRRAAMNAVGFGSQVTRILSSVGSSNSKYTDAFLVETPLFQSIVGKGNRDAEAIVSSAKVINEMDEQAISRRAISSLSAVRKFTTELEYDFTPVADPVGVMNEFYNTLFPKHNLSVLESDLGSLSFDPQDRIFSTNYLKLTKEFWSAVPKSRKLYYSKLKALNIPKLQNTGQLLLSAVASRNLGPPQLALSQNNELTAKLVWNNFLDKACVDDARDKLKQYQCDKVGLEEEGLREWAVQSTPEKVGRVKRILEELDESLAEMDVSSYLAMIKSDVKPTLSDKPKDTVTLPQVIVHHMPELSALFSSIFRVLVRRFLSLLKPNYHVNLLKDSKDIEAFIRAVHPYGKHGLSYLENDFSKYDKSQSEFVFILEHYVFTQLGMNEDLLRIWFDGHVKCRIRALSLGLSFYVMYQRKSGDATTAFGNVLLNIMSVLYSYSDVDVCWGVFMGDDSIMCVTNSVVNENAIRVLAEVFNLGAKSYLTDKPYFASNFILVYDNSYVKDVFLVPDPVKRIERWSMSINADDPQWHERYVSAREAMGVYLSSMKTAKLDSLVAQRYDVSMEIVKGLSDAIATVVSDEKQFRNMWEERFETLEY